LELIELNAKTREAKGKGAARKLRAGNSIPAIVYGAKKDPMMLSLDNVEFVKIIRDHGSTGLFFSLKIEGGIEKAVMLKEMQMDAFGLNYLHIDLHEVDMDHSVTVTVPVETKGESAGVKEGGMLQLIRRELDVVCKPADMPESIEIDVTDLNVGDSVHVEDIDLGDAVEIPHEVNFTVITIVPPTADSEEVSEEDEDLLEEEVEAAPAAE
jgi:large subunit ribosomal protein L25